MATIAVIGTLDTKGIEHAHLAERIRARGHTALLVDVGTGAAPVPVPDIDRRAVLAAAEINFDQLIESRDRGACVTAMSVAAPKLLVRLANEKKIDAVVSLGGGGGTAIATAAMRSLPLGFPKLMVSTLASGNTAHYMGTKDVMMMPSIVDIDGVNRISRIIFNLAAGAICGMVETERDETPDKPLIVASMFGNTTKCVNEAKKRLEEAGYEVLVFHATGIGGRAMESLVRSGLVSGILDVTTTEWADELVGGTLSAGPERLNAMSETKTPAVIAPGCLDMVNFGAQTTVPEKFKGRTFYVHNPQVTLMRTTAEECVAIGRTLAEKVNANQAPTAVMIPLKAISEIGASRQPFHDSAADAALFNALHKHAKVEVTDIDEEINLIVS